ncbi:MAG: abortive infection system antitoxin AbiGi family protein [Bermanella sp.]
MTEIDQNYVSSELLHFVGRGMNENDQFDLFIKILTEGWVTHPPHNPNKSGGIYINTDAAISTNDMYSPQITCFADIPLHDISLHMDKYSAIGMSFSKDFIANAGGVPVHYIPTESSVTISKNLPPEDILKIFNKHGGDSLSKQMSEVIPKSKHFNEMLQEFHELFQIFNDMEKNQRTSRAVSKLSIRILGLQNFLERHIFSYFKFFDHRKSDNDPENYYFEREWRIIGNLNFEISEVKTVLFPRKFSSQFRNVFPYYEGQVVFTD